MTDINRINELVGEQEFEQAQELIIPALEAEPTIKNLSNLPDLLQ